MQERSGATCHVAKPRSRYWAKGAKLPSHTTIMLTSSISCFRNIEAVNLFSEECIRILKGTFVDFNALYLVLQRDSIDLAEAGILLDEITEKTLFLASNNLDTLKRHILRNMP